MSVTTPRHCGRARLAPHPSPPGVAPVGYGVMNVS